MMLPLTSQIKAWRRASLGRTHDLYVAALIMESQTYLSGIIAYPTLHGRELACD